MPLTCKIFANSTNDSSDMWEWGVVFEENILKEGWHSITIILNPSE